MNCLACATNWRIPKEVVCSAIVALIVLLTILPGTTMIKAALSGELAGSSHSGFAASSVIDIRAQSGIKLSKGKFLVASRQLIDPNFARTVVLLIDYDRSGAMGLIINRPTEMSLSAAFPDMEELQDSTDTLFLGGPVGKSQILFLILSSNRPEDSRPVFDDIYISSSRALLQTMAHDGGPGKKFRLYAGYAGWASGQLDREVARGGWHILRADVATVFDKAPSEIWPELIHRSSALWVMASGDDN